MNAGSMLTVVGMLIAATGIGGMVVSLMMDVTVEVPEQRIQVLDEEVRTPAGRVYNLQLADNRRSCLITSAVAVLGGIMLMGIGLREMPLDEYEEKESARGKERLRQLLKRQAGVCERGGTIQPMKSGPREE